VGPAQSSLPSLTSHGVVSPKGAGVVGPPTATPTPIATAVPTVAPSPATSPGCIVTDSKLRKTASAQACLPPTVVCAAGFDEAFSTLGGSFIPLSGSTQLAGISYAPNIPVNTPALYPSFQACVNGTASTGVGGTDVITITNPSAASTTFATATGGTVTVNDSGFAVGDGVTETINGLSVTPNGYQTNSTVTTAGQVTFASPFANGNAILANSTVTLSYHVYYVYVAPANPSTIIAQVFDDETWFFDYAAFYDYRTGVTHYSTVLTPDTCSSFNPPRCTASVAFYNVPPNSGQLCFYAEYYTQYWNGYYQVLIYKTVVANGQCYAPFPEPSNIQLIFNS